jgi:CPA1 family monovalent cation:H+ antiporter
MLEKSYPEEIGSIEAFTRLKGRYERMAEIASSKLQQEESGKPTAHFLPKYRKMLLETVEARREELERMRRDKEFSDELLRKKEEELDLEEARLRK